MEVTIEKTKIVNFRSKPSLVEEAKEVIEGQSLTMAKALQLFLKNVVATKRINLLTEEELEKEKLFLELQQEIKKTNKQLKMVKGCLLKV